MQINTRHTSLTVLALAMLFPVSSIADPAAEIEKLKQENAQMKEMMMEMQEQMQIVIQQTKAMMEEAKEKPAGGVKAKKENITIATTGGGIKVKSSNGNSFAIGGRLQLDHDSYEGLWNTTDGSSSDENKIRRSRINVSGSSGLNWSYKLTVNVDHEGSNDRIDNGWFKYSFKPMYVQIGRYNRPAMLEQRTSSKWGYTIERSIVNELSAAVVSKPDFGGVQVGFATKDDVPMSGVIGIYDDELEGNGDGNSSVYGIGARFSAAPEIAGGFLHAGVSYYTADYRGANHQFRSRLGVNTAGRPFDTKDIETDDLDQYGLELAYVKGPLALQGEYMNLDAEGAAPSTIDGRDHEMDGFYLQAAYALTGETRGYKSGSGSFSRINPKSRMGAWEVVARYEGADVELSGGGNSGAEFERGGGELERWVLGLNWFATKNVQFQLNYIDAELDECDAGGTVLTGMGGSLDRCENDDGNAWSLRAQYVF